MTRLSTRVVAHAVIVSLLSTPIAAAAQTTQNTTVGFQYDAEGNLTQITDPRLAVTNNEYDSANRLKKTLQPAPLPLVSPARPVISFSYDGLDQLETVTDPRNLTTTYTVDGLGNETALASPDTASSSMTYDAQGNVDSSTDARGKRTTYTYDALNRLKTASYLTGVASVFEYDGGVNGPASAIGKLSKITDESGQTSYAFNAMGQLETKVQKTGTLTFTTRYTYGTEGAALGKVTSVTYPSGNRINYGYDTAGMVASLSLNRALAGGATDTSVTVPLLTNISYAPFGGPQSWEWGNHTTAQPNRYARTFDLDGRITSYPLGNVGGAPVDLTASVTAVPSALTFNASTGVYSGYLTLTNKGTVATGPMEIVFANLPAGVTMFSSSGTRDGAPFKLINNMTPNAQHSFAIQFKGTAATPVSYNNRVLSLISSGMTRTLGYDAASRITTMTHTGAGVVATTNQTFGYDDLDRLRSFTGNNNNHKYDYDATGNRTKTVIGASAYDITTSPTSNKLTSTTGPTPAKPTVTYAAGSILNDGTATYTYSDRGRMQRAVKGGVTTDYLYNALGQRVSKKRITATSFTNYYAYDEQGQLMGEYLGDGKAIQETVYLGSTPVAVLAGGIYYVYADHIDTARVITSTVDNVPVWRWDKADPFGAQLPEMNPHGRGVFTYNPRFPGQLFDKETNNHYYYYRDYDPQTGRYVQSDPIGLVGGINTYGYVNGNPLSLVDPLGLFAPPPSVVSWVGTTAGTTSAAAGAGVTASAAAGIGIGLGINHLVERFTSGSIGTHAYDLVEKICEPGKEDPCEAIRKQIHDLEQQLATRRGHLAKDQHNLYNRAYSSNPGGDIAKKGTFTGHVNKIVDVQVGLSRLIEKARKMGCL